MSIKGLFDRLFPAKYDFIDMLYQQAKLNGEAVDALVMWMDSGSEQDSETILEHIKKSDDVRMQLENNLVEAFSTPFDRGDVYLMSVSMHKVADYTRSTLLSMEAYSEAPNDIIRAMTKKLKKGCDILAEAMMLLEKTPTEAEIFIPELRRTHVDIDEMYRKGMAAVFKSSDAMYALKKREIYHHIKDASFYLEDCVDILHRIIVRLT